MTGRGRGRGVQSLLVADPPSPLPVKTTTTPVLIEDAASTTLGATGLGRGRGRGGEVMNLTSATIGNQPPPLAVATAPTGHGRGRGRGLATAGVNELPPPTIDTDRQPTPQPLSTPYQFADADEKTVYTVPEYSPRKPKRVMPLGSGGAYLHQSIQTCLHVKYFNTKVAPDPNLFLVSITAGKGKENKDAEEAGLADAELTPPRDVDDFQPPGSFPICLQEEHIEFVRDVIICSVIGIEDFIIRPAHSVQFAVFTTELNAWYNVNAKRYPAPEIANLVRGGHYVAFSPKVGNWCRVSLVNYKDNGEVILELLDFGKFLHTFVHEMRYIRKIFCDVPIQAVHAKIHMASGAYEWTETQHEKFKEYVDGKRFSVMTVSAEVDPTTGKRILGVVMMVETDGTLRPYTCEGCFNYGYEFGST